MAESKPFLLFVSLTEFFSDVLKRNFEGELDFKLKDCYILVCSRDITSDVARRNGQVNDFQSRYENVEFVSNLLPSIDMMEYVSTSGTDTFVDMYVERLYREDQMRDIISICDVVVKRNTPVFVISSSTDFKVQYPYILRDFIKDEFGLIGYTMSDFEGKDMSELLYDIGDRDQIIREIDDHIDMLLKTYDSEYFLNSLVDDVEQVYRDVLIKKSIEELKEMATAKMIFISRRDDKNRIIQKLIEELRMG